MDQTNLFGLNLVFDQTKSSAESKVLASFILEKSIKLDLNINEILQLLFNVGKHEIHDLWITNENEELIQLGLLNPNSDVNVTLPPLRFEKSGTYVLIVGNPLSPVGNIEIVVR